jgi:hypothetical protein
MSSASAPLNSYSCHLSRTTHLSMRVMGIMRGQRPQHEGSATGGPRSKHTHNTSHDACIGGDPDTDPARRFRSGGSCKYSRESASPRNGYHSKQNTDRRFSPPPPLYFSHGSRRGPGTDEKPDIGAGMRRYSPQNPMIVRASAQAIRRCWRWRSMCVASQSLLAHDRPMYTQNASEEWAPMTTAGAVAGRCREDTARAPGRTWMTCEGTTKCRLGRHQCMRTRGRGSAHRVGAGSDVGSMSL